MYQVQFPDGRIEKYIANIIAECLYAQVDQEGNQHVILDEIVDHEYDENVIPVPNSTKGWCLCVLWKDESRSWEQLKDMNHGFPIQAAEYAMFRGLQDLPAFIWWVTNTIKKKERIM